MTNLKTGRTAGAAGTGPDRARAGARVAALAHGRTARAGAFAMEGIALAWFGLLGDRGPRHDALRPRSGAVTETEPSGAEARR